MVVYTYVCMYVRTQRARTRTYVLMYVRAYVCRYILVYVCTYVCMKSETTKEKTKTSQRHCRDRPRTTYVFVYVCKEAQKLQADRHSFDWMRGSPRSFFIWTKQIWNKPTQAASCLCQAQSMHSCRPFSCPVMECDSCTSPLFLGYQTCHFLFPV